MPYDDGAIAVPDGPGLGVELDRDKLAEYAELYRELGRLPLRPRPGPPGLVPAGAEHRLGRPLMSIPRSADLASDVLTHTYDDMFNPPGLTNFLGTAQVDLDVFAIRSVNFPPYSHGDCITGQLYVDGRLARSYGGTVEVVWRPDQVVRATVVDGLELRSVTACAPGRPAVVVQLYVAGAPGRSVRLGFALDSTATRSGSGWLKPEPPSEPNTLTAVDGRVVGTGESGSAVSLQGLDVDRASSTGRCLRQPSCWMPAGNGRVCYRARAGRDLCLRRRSISTRVWPTYRR